MPRLRRHAAARGPPAASPWAASTSSRRPWADQGRRQCRHCRSGCVTAAVVARNAPRQGVPRHTRGVLAPSEGTNPHADIVTIPPGKDSLKAQRLYSPRQAPAGLPCPSSLGPCAWHSLVGRRTIRGAIRCCRRSRLSNELMSTSPGSRQRSAQAPHLRQVSLPASRLCWVHGPGLLLRSAAAHRVADSATLWPL